MLFLRIDYEISLLVPQSVASNTNMTLHVNVKKTPLKLSLTADGTDVFSLDGNMTIPDFLNFSKIINSTSQKQQSVDIKLKREVDRHDILRTRMKSIPGFKISWFYSGLGKEPQHDLNSTNDKITEVFVRFVNLIHLSKSNSSTNEIWNLVKNLKIQNKEWMHTEYCKHDEGQGFYDVSQVMYPTVKTLEDKLQINSSVVILENMSKDSLKSAAEMFLYLNSCSHFLRPWLSFYTDLFNGKSTSEIILSLNRIMKPWNNPRDIRIARKIFGNLTSMLALNYQTIGKIINGNSANLLKGHSV